MHSNYHDDEQNEVLFVCFSRDNLLFVANSFKQENTLVL